jgi:hypothetical protein
MADGFSRKPRARPADFHWQMTALRLVKLAPPGTGLNAG